MSKQNWRNVLVTDEIWEEVKNETKVQKSQLQYFVDILFSVGLEQVRKGTVSNEAAAFKKAIKKADGSDK